MEDLAKWLREQIAADERVAHASPVWAERLPQCEAHTAILDDSVDVLSGDGDGPDLAERTLRRLALAYQHRPGYQQEWKP